MLGQGNTVSFYGPDGGQEQWHNMTGSNLVA